MSQKQRSAKVVRHTVKKVSHPVAAKLRLLHHAHTGHLVHRHHTSYPILLILLVITGFFVLVGYDISAADTVGNVSVGVTVPKDPPAQGAVITSPRNGVTFKKSIIDVKGTCEPDTEVVVYSNNTLVGSTLCTASSEFELKIQLFAGANKLTALNYDVLNQAGPITPAVTVTYTASTTKPSSPVPVHPIVVPGVTPRPPKTCLQKPSSDACHVTYTAANSCDNYAAADNPPVSGDVRVAVVCLLRHAGTSGDTSVGILIWGGHAPYALTIDWGDGSADFLKSVETPGYFVVKKQYTSKGGHIITLRVSDKNGKQAYVQATVDVAGLEDQDGLTGYIKKSLSASWFDSPVPIYLLAVAVVLGFWAGDYFERSILFARKSRGSRHRPA